MNCGIVIRPDSPGGTTLTARTRSSGPVAAVAPAIARAMASTARATAIRQRIADGFYASSTVSFRRRSEANSASVFVNVTRNSGVPAVCPNGPRPTQEHVLKLSTRAVPGEATMSLGAGRLAFVGAIAAIFIGGAVTASATPRNPGWMHLSSPEAGVSFDFPPLGGKVSYQFTHNARATRPCGVGDTGLTYDWVVEGVPRNSSSTSYLIAGGV